MKVLLFVTICMFALFSWSQSAQEKKQQEPKQSQYPEIHQNNAAPPQPFNANSRDAQFNLDSRSIQENESAGQIQQIYLQFNTGFKASTTMNNRKTPTKQQLDVMNLNLQIMKGLNSESFEYNLGVYLASRHDVSKVEYLKKALDKNAFNKDANVQMAFYYTILNDRNKRMKYLNNLYNAGHFSSDLIHYAQLLLESLPSNSIVITHGVDDAIPLFIQQDVKQKRGDVKIISLELLQSSDYRHRLTSDGFNLPKSEIIDTKYLQEFCALNSSKQLYVALSVPKPYLQNLQSTFYIKGLTMVNRETSDRQNLDLYMEKFNRFRTLTKPYTAAGKAVYMNALPFLISAHRAAKQAEDKKMAREIELKIKEISEWNKKWEVVQTLLDK